MFAVVAVPLAAVLLFLPGDWIARTASSVRSASLGRGLTAPRRRGGSAVVEERAPDGVGVDRPAEVESLDELAVHRLELVALVEGLDSFGDDREAESGGEADDVAHHFVAVVPVLPLERLWMNERSIFRTSTFRLVR